MFLEFDNSEQEVESFMPHHIVINMHDGRQVILPAIRLSAVRMQTPRWVIFACTMEPFHLFGNLLNISNVR